MFNNIPVIGETERANAGAVELFTNRQVKLSNKELVEHNFKYVTKITYMEIIYSPVCVFFIHLTKKTQSV